MSENVKTSPNPIQRNFRDVAFELSKLYLDRQNVIDLEKIQSTYIKMYAAVVAADVKSTGRQPNEVIKELIPEELR